MTTPQDPRDDQPGHYQPAPPLTPSAGDFASASPGPRPKEVDISFWLWVASFVIGLLGLFYFAAEFDTIRNTAMEEARRQAVRGGTVDEKQIESITNVFLVVGVVIGVLVSAAQVLLAYLMRNGRNWARIVLTVIGGLSLLGGLFSLGDTSGQGLLDLVRLLLIAGALVTMFLPAANPWFRRRPSY
jgi:FtsH-binding integral membrane protein